MYYITAAKKQATAKITESTTVINERRINRLRAKLEAAQYARDLSFSEGELKLSENQTFGGLVRKAAHGWEGNQLNRVMTFQSYLTLVIDQLF